MKSYNEIYQDMEKHFDINDKTRKRFLHSIGVVNMAVKMNEALNLGIDPETVKIAAILHDYAKIYNVDEQISLLKKYDQKSISLNYPSTIHAYLAPYLLKERYPDISNEILDAIKYHTTAKPKMSKLEALIYSADAVDETRDYEDLKYFQKLCVTNLNQATYEILDYTVRDLKFNHKPMHPETIKAHQYYQSLKGNIDADLNKIIDLLKSTILENVYLYHTKDYSPFFDYVIIADANNERLASATIEHLRDLAELNHMDVIGYSKDSHDWFLIDLSNVIIHIFKKEDRTKYNLDGIYYNLEKEVIQ